MAARILVGTCGWSDHQGFYPPGLAAAARLAYYSTRFPLVEVDSSYYGISPPRRTAAWAASTPEGFRFNVKAFRSMTYHEREGGRPRDPTPEEEADFRACLEPLRASGKLAALHFQFPPWFNGSPLNQDRLARLRESLPEDLLVVELRNRSWADPGRWAQLCDLLTKARISLCMVDEPQLGSGSFPRLVQVTDPRLAVVRFRGRNAGRWYQRGQSAGDRFDYLYRSDELEGWRGDILRLGDEVEELHLLFNNCHSDHAVVNGLQMAEILELPLTEPVLDPKVGPGEPELRPEPGS